MDRKRYLTKLIVSNESAGTGTCPIEKFRDASILELINFLNNVSDEEVISILQKHKKM